MERVKIITNPGQPFLQRIASFSQKEALWNTTPFELSLTSGPFFVITDSADQVLATASISLLSEVRLRLGNVVVAKDHRRQGLGTALVQAVIRYVESMRSSTEISLIASPLGGPLYSTLGFSAIENVTVHLYKLPPAPPPELCSTIPNFPTEEQHEEAIKLYHESTGLSRRKELRDIFRESQQCAVLVVKGTIVAAAWARFTADLNRVVRSGVFLGPVVAKSPDYAESVCSGILRMKDTNGRTNSSRGVMTLVPEKKGSERGPSLFKALGFGEEYEMQFMVKHCEEPKSSNTPGPDFTCETSKHFALLGWDLG